MKIYTLNYSHGNNYGAVLVEYALQNILRKYSDEVISIHFEYQQSAVKRLCNRIIKALFNPDIAKRYINKIGNLVKQKEKENAKVKNTYCKADSTAFDDFRKKYLRRTDRYTSVKALKTISFNADDVVVCGSDVIWNQGNESLTVDAYFLAWVPNNIKKIALAPSWGGCTVNSLNEATKKRISEYLSRFDAVSVRENSGLEICFALGRKDTKWLPDPTMLLSADDWNKIAEEPELNKYILNYHIPYNDSVNYSSLLELLTICKDTKIVTLPNLNDKNVWISPCRWLGMIRCADYVVTNSFHGTIFCILYHKSFFFTKLTNSFEGHNERLYSLLGYFGLEERILDEKKLNDNEFMANLVNKKIDWDKVDNKLSVWRQEAFEYLDKAVRS